MSSSVSGSITFAGEEHYAHVLALGGLHAEHVLCFQDSQDPNPLIRALAVRTMGCIRVDKITEYLCDPLQRCLKVCAQLPMLLHSFHSAKALKS